MNATSNGRARKSLADQIDRLDNVLDGLADGLNDAVAQAVKEAVRTVVGELLAHPEIVARLSVGQAVPTAEPTQKAGVAAAARRAWMWLRVKCGLVHGAIAGCATPIRHAAKTVQSKAAQLASNVRTRLFNSLVWGLARIGRLRAVVISRLAVFGLGFGLGILAGFFLPGAWMMLGAIVVGLSAGWQLPTFFSQPL